MKKIGSYTVRGKVNPKSSSVGKTQKVRLFDGQFNTGYVVTKFIIGINDPDNASNDVYGILLTEDLYDGADKNWNWGDNREIGWAAMPNVYTDSGVPGMPFNLVDRDNFIVEDLYVYVRSGTSAAAVNYYIELDKYDTTDARGALAMVRNSSQSV